MTPRTGTVHWRRRRRRRAVAWVVAALVTLAGGDGCGARESAAGGAPKAAPKAKDDTKTKKKEGKAATMDRFLVRVALDSVGDAYLEAERAIVAAGDRLHPALREAAAKGGAEGAVAELLLSWPADGETHEACVAEMARIEEEAKVTAVGYPTAPKLANALSKKFGPACVRFLSVRVSKESAAWPNWKTHGVLIYLHRAGDARAMEPLLKLLWSAEHPVIRDEIVATLRDYTDPAAAARVRAELERYEKMAEALRSVSPKK